ncbi:hypothetical protein JOD63_002464 [Microbacterium terrae]|uniref:DUF4397 domain-containing protein n=2 Tax=Microbacterium terrae TaxID=69369 RepID=A0A0M2HG85_9MICO|nr:hypothetical protein RS81_00904 [Microbacterium terrae]MBP1078496.1 hypothetical protein [Microbacterium terrae]
MRRPPPELEHIMRKTTAAGIAAGLVAALGLALPASAISDTSADLSVLHGIPDTPVDVYVNGELTIDDFQPGDLAGPLDLPAGDYEVALTATDAADDSSPVLGPITLTLEATMSYTAAAHLDEAGDPTVTAFSNDLSATAAGEGRLTVRHVAAAPAVDVLAGDTAVITGLVNPDESSLDLAAGTISAAVALEGTTDPVIGPADVTVDEGALTIVYAWGSAEAGNLDLAVQNITGLHSSPDGVPSGTAGYLAERDAQMTALWIVGAAAVIAFAVTAGVVVVRRRASQDA